jgi:hypothetical protein
MPRVLSQSSANVLPWLISKLFTVLAYRRPPGPSDGGSWPLRMLPPRNEHGADDRPTECAADPGASNQGLAGAAAGVDWAEATVLAAATP